MVKLLRCRSYCAPALASSAYALAVLQYRPPRVWAHTLLVESQRQMPAFGAQELSNLVWALAVLGLQPGAAWFRDFEVQVGGPVDSCVCRRQQQHLYQPICWRKRWEQKDHLLEHQLLLGMYIYKMCWTYACAVPCYAMLWCVLFCPG